MKLIVMIPAYNEADHLAGVLADIPEAIPGIVSIVRLVVDDGSTDLTADVARAAGADIVVRHRRNRGLARAFMTGLQRALDEGADIIVNTDGDHQYRGADIERLIRPILEGDADVVVGARDVAGIGDFSRLKKRLQRIGSALVRLASNTSVPDAVSGFRAFRRDAARQIAVYNDFTYSVEMLIQAGEANLAVATVPITTNAARRSSRLAPSMLAYIRRMIITIVRAFVVYRPFRFFLIIGNVIVVVGAFVLVQSLQDYRSGSTGLSLGLAVMGAGVIVAGLQTILTAFLADSLSVNRKILEQIRYRTSGIQSHSVGRTDRAPIDGATT